jgi:DnaJ-class molecular chaperone
LTNDEEGQERRRIKCPRCDGIGASRTVVRSGVNEDGTHWHEYLICPQCNGERYIQEVTR